MSDRQVVKFTPAHLAQNSQGDVPLDWWNQKDQVMADSVKLTLEALRVTQTQRFRQLAMSAMLYGNRPAFQAYGTNQLRLVRSQAVPVGRLTYNVIQAAIDTLSGVFQDLVWRVSSSMRAVRNRLSGSCRASSSAC